MKKLSKILALMMVMIMIASMVPITSAGALSVYPEMDLNTMVEVKCDGKTHSYTFRPQQDGWYKFASGGEADCYITLYDKFLREVDYSDDGDDQNFFLVTELEAGELYYVKVATWEKEEGTFFFDVETATVATSVEIVSMPYDTTVVRDYEYDTVKLDGLEVKFTLTDGSQVYWDLNSEQKVGDDYVYINSDFDENDDFCVEIFCGGAYAKIPYTVVESNVESIEYSCEKDIVYYENSNGYYDDELGYYVYFSDLPYDAVITINYKDGTSKQVTVNELFDDNKFSVADTQDSQPWVLDGENYIYVIYLGAEVAVPVSVLPCSIAKVTINSLPEKVYYLGDEKIGFIDYDDVYRFSPDDLSGLSFTVEYTDGTVKTYTDEDIDEYDGTIDGYTYDVSEVACENVGVYTATLSYKGYEFDFDVEVKETPVEGIEFLKDADRIQYEEYYHPVFDGMQVKVNFKDGTSKIIDITSENTSYIYDSGLSYIIDVDGEKLYADFDFDDDDNECYSFYICGYKEYYYGFEFVETRTVEDVQFENVSDNGDDMVATITYEDGAVEELTLDIIAYEQCDDFCSAYAMTENGITYYSIEKLYNEDGSAYYYIDFLDEYYEVEMEQNGPMLGDVDGDGEVTIMDATAIQLHIAKKITLSDSQLSVADVDFDGVASVMDATAIQRYVAKLITEF